SPQLSTFFLDFLENNFYVKKIAYAASFGVSNWEFNNEQTKIFSKLLKLFDAVSVREDSAVELCDNYLGVKATHLLDPTLLLNKEDYELLLENEEKYESTGELFTYILNK